MLKRIAMKKWSPLRYVFLFFALLVAAINGEAQKILRVAVAGLAHDHVHGILNQYKKGEVIIIGIAESDRQLVLQYEKNYQLPDSLFL